MFPFPINEELFDKWIEFEKWKLEKQHSHEIELKKMELEFSSSIESSIKKQRGYNKSIISPETDPVEVLKNKVTLFGEDNPSYIGKIARTKIFYQADAKSKELAQTWKNYLVNSLGYSSQEADKLRPVIRSFYAVAATSQRCCDYPEAKDKEESISWVKNVYLKTLKSKPKKIIIDSYECIKNTWSEGFDFNVSLIGDFLDEIYSSQIQEENKKDQYKFVNSPLYEKVIADYSLFDGINPNTIESLIYSKNNGNYLAGMISALTVELKNQRPEFLSEEVDEEDWAQLWPQYLGVCKKKWQEDLIPKINLAVLEQKKWEKEKNQA